MLERLFPKYHRRCTESAHAKALRAFAHWLDEAGYGRDAGLPMHITDSHFRGRRTRPERLALTGDGGDCTCREGCALANRIARGPAPHREGRGRAVG